MMDETSHDLPDPLLNLTDRAAAGVTPLEQEVLDEYTRLLKNMNHVCEQQRLFSSSTALPALFLFLDFYWNGFLPFLPFACLTSSPFFPTCFERQSFSCLSRMFENLSADPYPFVESILVIYNALQKVKTSASSFSALSLWWLS